MANVLGDISEVRWMLSRRDAWEMACRLELDSKSAVFKAVAAPYVFIIRLKAYFMVRKTMKGVLKCWDKP